MKKVFQYLSGAAVAAVTLFAVICAVPAMDAYAVIDTQHWPLFGIGGLLVNKDTLSRIFTGLKTIFHNTLTSVKGGWQDTTMEVPSTGKGEDYMWLKRFPRMRKWIGDKYVKNLEAEKYYKANEDWETTIAVDRNDIQDDSLGIYNAQAQMAGESAGELNDIIDALLKNNAFTQEGIDGQYFYDDDHEVNGASVSNKGTVALSAASQAAALASYGAARAAIMSVTDDEGEPLGLVPNTLEVGPALESVAKIICEKDKLVDNSPNPWMGTAKVKINPRITSATQWMLHVTNKQSIKPFIIQMRQRPIFVSQTSMENDDVFMRRTFKYGAEARATGLFGFWQLSWGSTGTG